jgi:hypothetical protein
MTNPFALAEKIAAKAAEALAPLEVVIARWPAEFRTIMWRAVVETASRLEAEAAAAHAKATGERP